MRKLVLLSPLIAMVVIPYFASKLASPQAGLRKTVTWTLAFFVLWSLLGPRLYLMIHDD
jgi:hypothetical protein